MRRIGRYISYIIALCSVLFCIYFTAQSPWPILPKAPFSGSAFLNSLLPDLTPVAPVAPVAPLISSTGIASVTTDLYPKILSHLVKVNNIANGASGSGVIIWSGLDNNGMGHTYILTNRHVLPVGQLGTVEIFSYLNFRGVEAIKVFPVFAVTQCSTADLALVEILSSETLANKATFIQSSDYEHMSLYTELLIAGCGLGNPPFISSAKIIIFEKERLTLNGFSVWGCSGGGVFDNQGRLVSITCQIGMATIGGQDHPITNISISIPVNVICDWLLTTNYKFIVNSELGSINDIIKPKKFY